MADLKISQLGALAAANVASTDVLAIVDTSASETKKITLTDLLSNSSFTLVADASIPNAKIVWTNGTLAGSVLANQGVDTTQIANDAITSVQLDDESTVDLVTTLPGSGGYVGQLAVDTDGAYKTYVWDGSAWQAITAGTTTISGSNAGLINIVSTASGTTYTISATIDDTDAAGKFLAGPTGAGGAVSARVIAGSDLPDPTTSAKGGVIINGNGLTQTSGTIKIDNTVTASGNTRSLVTYDANGLVLSGSAIAAGDLPVATASAVGGVKIGSGLSVSGAGEVTITNSVTGATKAKITYNNDGLVTAGADLAAGDLPAHSAALLTSGTLDIARIAGKAVTAAKMADSSTCIVQSIAQAGFPTAAFTGQLCFDSVAEDAYLWDGNAWQAITTLTKGSLVNGGTINCSTSKMVSVTTAGSAAGLVVGSNLPTPSATTDGVYVVVATGGTPSAPAPVTALNPPDYILGVTNASGSSWNEIDLSSTVSGQTCSNVSFTPYGQVSSTNAQDAIEELETEKMPKAGGTFTGAVEIGHGGSLSFEGATNNAYETLIAVVDPTADRTITLPNSSGTIALTSDVLATSGGTLTGNIVLDNDKEIRFNEADSNGSAYVGVKGATDKGSSSSYTISLPAAAPTANQVLKADSSTPTNLTWAADSATDATKMPLAGGTFTGAVTFDNGTTATFPGAFVYSGGGKASFQTGLAVGTSTNSDTVDLTNQSTLKFIEPSSAGGSSEFIGFRAPDEITSSVTFKLPAADGTNGYALKTDGSGNLGWTAITDSTKMPLAGGTFTGNVLFSNGKAARFYENDGNGSNYVGFRAPASLSADTTFYWPAADGSATHVLTTDGSGNLSFAAPAAAGATGGGSDEIFVENERTVTSSYSITATKNANSVGPVALNSGVVVTVPSASTWLVS